MSLLPDLIDIISKLSPGRLRELIFAPCFSTKSFSFWRLPDLTAASDALWGLSSSCAIDAPQKTARVTSGKTLLIFFMPITLKIRGFILPTV